MNKFYLILILLIFIFPFKSKGQKIIQRKLIKIAKKVPDSITKFPSDIVDYFKLNTKNPEELVFLFSYWVSQNINYDFEKYLNNDNTYTNFWKTLETRKTMCQGYSELFYELCFWAEIKCEIISGYAKGFDYIKKPMKDTNHIWNAVLINNTWKLVDITWASGFVDTRKDEYFFKKKFRKEYIFANPFDLILTHLPSDPKWQLLNKTISFNEFFSEIHDNKRLDLNKN